MNMKLLGLFAMLALAAGCMSTTEAELASEEELASEVEMDSEVELDNEEELDAEEDLANEAEMASETATDPYCIPKTPDPYFHCKDEHKGGTPWFDKHYDPSSAVSSSLLNEHIPQGLATWKNYYGSGKDLLVYTAYSQHSNRARIQGIDAAHDLRTNFAEIRKGHAGGVAIIGKWAFVSGPNATSVYRYRLNKLADVFEKRTSDDVLDGALAGTVDANAFLASEGNVLYAGQFNSCGLGTMRGYPVDPTTGDLGAPGRQIQVPKKTQGLTVLPNYFIFSTSYGRKNRSNVYVVKRGYEKLRASYRNGNLRCVRIPTMSEGVTLSNNRIYQLFESGADCYANDEQACGHKGKPTTIIKRLYRIPRSTLVDKLPVLH